MVSLKFLIFGSPKDDLLHRPDLIKGGGGQKLPILRR
jgi:hypothetical protein